MAFWPLDALWGSVVAWNLLLLLVTFAAGVVAYLWLRELDVPPVAAALGGSRSSWLRTGSCRAAATCSAGPRSSFRCLYGPSNARAARASPEPRTFGARSRPWARSRSRSPGQLHLALGALPFVGAYAAVRYARVASLWAWGGVLAGAAAGLVAEAVVISGSTESEGRTLAEVASCLGRPAGLREPWRLHGPERFVYLGWLLPVLAIAGLVLLARRRREARDSARSRGRRPCGARARDEPAALRDRARRLPTPLRYPRVPGRFLPLANLALAALAAVAVAAVVARFEADAGLP